MLDPSRNDPSIDSFHPLRPPCYALIRGPFGRAGYQVATVVRDDDPYAKIVLVFSDRDKAEAYGRRRPQGHDDWRAGTLPTWRRLLRFLEGTRTTARSICIDFCADPTGNELAESLDSLIERIAPLAEAECRGSPSPEA